MRVRGWRGHGGRVHASAIVMAVVLVVTGGVLVWSSVQNAHRYWEATHPPDGAEQISVEVRRRASESCRRPSRRGAIRCAGSVDAVEFRALERGTQRAEVGREISPGDTVRVFQDSDGEWQVEDGFTTGWAVRAIGLTGLFAIAFLVIAAVILRGRAPWQGTRRPAA